jgi:hypothetical protein
MPLHLYERINAHQVRRFDQIYDFFKPGQLLEGDIPDFLQPFWEAARSDCFERK